jgi:hypothetical protein
MQSRIITLEAQIMAIKNYSFSNIGNLVVIKKHGRGATAYYEVRYTPDGNVKPVFTKHYWDALGTRAENIRRIQFYFNKNHPFDLTELSY